MAFVDIFNTTNKYKVILADPPWIFETYTDSGKDRSAEQHYKCLTLEDVKNLPIKKIADKDCALFMWVTDPMLHKGFDVLKAWGFTYKTVAFTWAKVNKSAKLESLNASKDFFTGMGYWTRANPEICLLGLNYEEENLESERCLLATKGSPKRVAMDVRRLIVDYRREHSQKPVDIYNRIDRLMGNVPKIELFARNEKDGWHCWGNETTKYGKV